MDVGDIAQAWTYVRMAVTMARDLGMCGAAEKWRRTGEGGLVKGRKSPLNREDGGASVLLLSLGEITALVRVLEHSVWIGPLYMWHYTHNQEILDTLSSSVIENGK